MKKVTPFLLLFTVLFLAGCKNTLQDNPTDQGTGDVTNTGGSNRDGDDEISIGGSQVNNGTGTSDAEVTSYQLDMSGGRDTISIDLQSGDKIVVAIKTVLPQTFFRVSQIVYPDGSMDGPFEDGHTFDITTAGSYQFIVAPNMMASNEVYTGMIDVELSLFR